MSDELCEMSGVRGVVSDALCKMSGVRGVV